MREFLVAKLNVILRVACQLYQQPGLTLLSGFGRRIHYNLHVMLAEHIAEVSEGYTAGSG